VSHPIAVVAEHPALRSNFRNYLVVPEADLFLSPILATVPARTVSYHMSAARGIDPGFPRNLSKTLAG
jgi:glucosamine--fructose-6-phosphate aminotransferase (isomerizing)